MFKKGLLKQLSILLVGSNLIFGQIVGEMNSPDFIKSIIFKSLNDIIFDGISLMKNYRADFREHVSHNGIESLITSLRE